MEDKSGSGVGLEQVSRRLEILYQGITPGRKAFRREAEHPCREISTEYQDLRIKR